MRQTILYIASSLDGYIAGPKNQLDFLFHEEDFGYEHFIPVIDTTLMGFKTYEEVLGFGVPFPYPDKTNYVFSRQFRPADHNPVQFIKEDPAVFVARLKASPGGKIWVVGGSQLNGQLLAADLIDEIQLFIHPTALGVGIPLFKTTYAPRNFKLQHCQPHPSGVIMASYLRAEKPDAPISSLG
jgi:dihydrofolate reductase